MKIRNILILISFISFCSVSYSQLNLNTKYEKIGEKGLAYVCHISQYYVTVIDLQSNEPIGKINCSHGSTSICFSPDGKTGYISNFNSGNITVYDRKTNEIIATVDAGENASGVFPVQNGKYIFISHESKNNALWVMDAKSNSIFKKLDWGSGQMYFVENQSKIYEPQIFTPYVFVIDPNTLEVTKKIETGGRPMSMAYVPADNSCYVANFDFNELTKINTKSDEIVKHIKNFNYARGIAASTDGKLVFVTDVVENRLNVLFTKSDSLIATIDGFTMPTSIDVSADGKYVYVTNQGGASVSVVDAVSFAIVKTIKVADNPISIYIDK